MTFEQLHKDIDYNAHDMGEIGVFIRTEYAHNKIDDCKQRVKEVVEKVLRESGCYQEYKDSVEMYIADINRELGLED